MAYNITYLNQIVADLGGSDTYIYEIDALNAICTLVGVTAGHKYKIDALNAIDVNQGGSGGHKYNIDALNSIITLAGETAGYTYEQLAWAAIQQGALVNYNWAEQPEVLFYGLVSEIAGGQMPNKVTGATDYLTVAGSAGSETYQAPNTTPYKNADTDYIWFKTDASQRTTTTAELIGYDLPRTIVKYADISPYAIESIMILKAGETLSASKENAMRDAFHLSNWWSGTLSLHGVVKGNRSSAKSTWTPESVAPDVPSGLTLTLISGGVQIDWTDTNSGLAQTEIYAKVDDGTSALLYTIAAGTITKNDIRVPEITMHYKVRALKDGNYSEFTEEQSISMLGPEKITNGHFDSDSGWTKQIGWTISGGTANCNVTDDSYKGMYQNAGLVLNEYYCLKLDIVRTSGTLRVQLADTGGTTGRINYTSSGTKKDILQKDVSGGNFFLFSWGSFVGSVDNVSVRKVLMP